ncbi:hypothetical protein PYW07_005419 [Mythimna separata]|uniref:MADF domain-containing protein n=1 Tax=Mythimna separata TaxID=271217 RepID=A0AAD7YF85_MYTSE|nr:hypothetical protein PYW07_005419 [Mythimna separata]
MTEILAEELIPLVEQRKVLWDKNSEFYKDKILKAAAWREICCVFNPDFDKLKENEMKDFVKSVTTKWIYIRDAFLRSQRTEKNNMRFGCGKKPRPYVYKNLLSFLTKADEAPTRPESSNNSQSSSESSSDSEDAPAMKIQPPPAQKKLRVEKIMPEDKMIRIPDPKFVETEEHPQISFMKGILPSIATFDDDENLEFQAGVVALVQNIRRKRQSHGAYTYDVKIFET